MFKTTPKLRQYFHGGYDKRKDITQRFKNITEQPQKHSVLFLKTDRKDQRLFQRNDHQN
jgi:hypothetical protein